MLLHCGFFLLEFYLESSLDLGMFLIKFVLQFTPNLHFNDVVMEKVFLDFSANFIFKFCPYLLLNPRLHPLAELILFLAPVFLQAFNANSLNFFLKFAIKLDSDIVFLRLSCLIEFALDGFELDLVFFCILGSELLLFPRYKFFLTLNNIGKF